MNKVEVIFGVTFRDDLASLRHRYRHVFDDIEPLVERLERGEKPGDKLIGVRRDTYKVRLPNSSAQRGKSGGFRVIYYVQLADRVILLTIYSKTDQSDISVEKIRRLIDELD